MLIIAVAVVLAMLLWPEDPPPGADPGAAVASEPGRTAAPRSARRSARDLPASPAEQAVQTFLEANRYPPSQGRLTHENVDLLDPFGWHGGVLHLEDASGAPVQVTFSADRHTVTGAEEVRATLEARRRGAPIALRIIASSAVAQAADYAYAGAPRGTVPTDPGANTLEERRLPLGFVDDAHVYRARITPTEAFPDHHGDVRLEVTYAFEAETEERRVHLKVFVTPEDLVPARFTGAFADRIVEGSLLVEAGIEVFDPGPFVIDANLLDARGEPVAWTRYKGDLPSGSTVVPLSFFGLVLRDAGGPSPWTVRDLRGYRVSFGDVVTRRDVAPYAGTHVTRAYPLDDLTSEVYDSEEKRRALDALREEAQRNPPPLPAGDR